MIDFVEVPLNQTLTAYPPEMVATFRCHHESPQARITWLINGIVFRGSPQSDIEFTYITHGNGSETGILTISNNPQYNGTQIVCEASLAASREVTPVAILTIMTGRIDKIWRKCVTHNNHNSMLPHVDTQSNKMIIKTMDLSKIKSIGQYVQVVWLYMYSLFRTGETLWL